jgi:hypothetical protein
LFGLLLGDAYQKWPESQAEVSRFFIIGAQENGPPVARGALSSLRLDGSRPLVSASAAGFSTFGAARSLPLVVVGDQGAGFEFGSGLTFGKFLPAQCNERLIRWKRF